MIEVTVAARSEGGGSDSKPPLLLQHASVLRMPADNKTKGAHVCAAWTGGGSRQMGHGGTRHAARGMFRGPASFRSARRDCCPATARNVRGSACATENGQDVPSFYFCSGKKKIDTDAPQGSALPLANNVYYVCLGCRIPDPVGIGR